MIKASYEYGDYHVKIILYEKQKLLSYKMYREDSLIFDHIFKDAAISALIKATAALSEDVKKGVIVKE